MLVKKQWLKYTKAQQEGKPIYNIWEGWFLFGLIPLVLIQKGSTTVKINS